MRDVIKNPFTDINSSVWDKEIDSNNTNLKVSFNDKSSGEMKSWNNESYSKDSRYSLELKRTREWLDFYRKIKRTKPTNWLWETFGNEIIEDWKKKEIKLLLKVADEKELHYKHPFPKELLSAISVCKLNNRITKNTKVWEESDFGIWFDGGRRDEPIGINKVREVYVKLLDKGEIR